MSFVQNLYRIFPPSLSICCCEDGAVRTLPKSPTEIEVFHPLFDNPRYRLTIFSYLLPCRDCGTLFFPGFATRQWSTLDVRRRGHLTGLTRTGLMSWNTLRVSTRWNHSVIGWKELLSCSEWAVSLTRRSSRYGSIHGI